MIESKIEIKGQFVLEVKQLQPGMIEVQVRTGDQYITFVISSEDYLKLRVLEASSKFLDVGLKF